MLVLRTERFLLTHFLKSAYQEAGEVVTLSKIGTMLYLQFGGGGVQHTGVPGAENEPTLQQQPKPPQ